MRAVVVSDSHGDRSGLQQMLEYVWHTSRFRDQPIDAYFHLGDGAADFTALTNLILRHDPAAALHQVRGNCDFSAYDTPDDKVAPFGGINIYLCHGHLKGVKTTLDWLDDTALGFGCAIALYGHTHKAHMEMRRTLLLNPGAAEDGRLLLLEVTDARPNVEMLDLRRKI